MTSFFEGSPEQVLQFLSNQIGDLRTQVQRHEIELKAQKAVINVVAETFGSIDPRNRSTMLQSLEILRDGFMNEADNFGQKSVGVGYEDYKEAAATLSVMARHLDDILDISRTTPAFVPTVIDGGKE